MDRDELRKRTKESALRIVRLVAALPGGRIGDVLGRQLLRAGTSVGANYREALRASSKRHFTSLIEISLREADEALY
ncbi:MAG: four helix bundle protein [Thermoguttaceae bacterium]|jgi:four helix bundle protein